jgi:hypothetical protein
MAIEGMIGIDTCYTRASTSVPVSEDTGHDEGVGKQVAAKDGEAHQCNTVSNPWIVVRLLA